MRRRRLSPPPSRLQWRRHFLSREHFRVNLSATFSGGEVVVVVVGGKGNKEKEKKINETSPASASCPAPLRHRLPNKHRHHRRPSSCRFAPSHPINLLFILPPCSSAVNCRLFSTLDQSNDCQWDGGGRGEVCVVSAIYGPPPVLDGRSPAPRRASHRNRSDPVSRIPTEAEDGRKPFFGIIRFLCLSFSPVQLQWAWNNILLGNEWGH